MAHISQKAWLQKTVYLSKKDSICVCTGTMDPTLLSRKHSMLATEPEPDWTLNQSESFVQRGEKLTLRTLFGQTGSNGQSAVQK